MRSLADQRFLVSYRVSKSSVEDQLYQVKFRG